MSKHNGNSPSHI
ncbi:hypothetical protein V2J09_009627 [Rumex salicifolius]